MNLGAYNSADNILNFKKKNCPPHLSTLFHTAHNLTLICLVSSYFHFRIHLMGYLLRRPDLDFSARSLCSHSSLCWALLRKGAVGHMICVAWVCRACQGLKVEQEHLEKPIPAPGHTCTQSSSQLPGEAPKPTYITDPCGVIFMSICSILPFCGLKGST